MNRGRRLCGNTVDAYCGVGQWDLRFEAAQVCLYQTAGREAGQQTRYVLYGFGRRRGRTRT